MYVYYHLFFFLFFRVSIYTYYLCESDKQLFIVYIKIVTQNYNFRKKSSQNNNNIFNVIYI